MNPLAGILLIALGSIGAASFYVPFKKVKSWAWESYWLSQGVAAWLIAPILFAYIFVPQGELLPIINEAPLSAKLMAMFFGVLWGFGGLTFGSEHKISGSRSWSEYCPWTVCCIRNTDTAGNCR